MEVGSTVIDIEVPERLSSSWKRGEAKAKKNFQAPSSMW